MKKRLVKNPLGMDLPQPIESEKLERLVISLKDGSITNEELKVIFFGHLRLAMSIVADNCNESNETDLIGESLLAIAEAINKAKERLVDNNITPYIISFIKGKVKDYISNQHLVPGRTYRWKKINEPSYIAPHYDTLDKAHEHIESLGLNITEIMDLIEACVMKDNNLKRREYKRVVIKLRRLNYTNAEIAKILEVSESYVQALVSEIRNLYKKEIGHGE